jgi:hypothetical protein
MKDAVMHDAEQLFSTQMEAVAGNPSHYCRQCD